MKKQMKSKMKKGMGMMADKKMAAKKMAKKKK